MVSSRLPGSPLTFYTRYGDLPFALPCGVAAAAVLAMVYVRERRKMKLEPVDPN